jgi:hypothetical protein
MPASIWLQLSDERMVGDLVAELAARHGTMRFQPHLTVCGFPLDDVAAASAASGYVRGCGLLPLRLKKSGISYSTTAPFKAVVIDVENTAELRSFRGELRRIAGAPKPESPHISLLYTIGADQSRVAWASDDSPLRAIACECAERIEATEFALNRPVLVSPDGDWTDIASWRIVRKF